MQQMNSVVVGNKVICDLDDTAIIDAIRHNGILLRHSILTDNDRFFYHTFIYFDDIMCVKRIDENTIFIERRK